MFHPLPLFVGLRYARARTHRYFVSFITWVSLAGVCVGVAALIVILSVMNGFESELRDRLLALSAPVRVTADHALNPDWEAVRRDVAALLPATTVERYSEVQALAVHQPEMLPLLLRYLTVQVSDMFRDPGYWRAIRTHVIPVLATYPSFKIWIAGCSTGEEVYSMAICLQEAGLLARSLIYATDINNEAQRKAAAGVYEVERVAQFSKNYQEGGGTGSLSDYYTATYGSAVMDKRLSERVVFSDHSLATDSVFTEVHFVSCRNVFIYFSRELQERALGLFADSLCPRGFLGMGSRESLRFIDSQKRFVLVDETNRLYRKAVGT